MYDLPRVSTHQLCDGRRLNRLNAYRLKDAKRRRDAAIAAANERYAREVATLTGPNERLATLALARGEAANLVFGEREPADELLDPQPSAMTGRMAVAAGNLVRRLARTLRGQQALASYGMDSVTLLRESPPCQNFAKPKHGWVKPHG